MKYYILLISLFIYSISFGAILFEDSFNNSADWTVTQPNTGSTSCDEPICSPVGATQWDGYLSGMSYCDGKPGSNNFYLNSIPGYPIESTPGTGKVITFWDESCTDSFEDSDGQVSKSFTGQDEVYVQFKIKFSPGYQWETSGISSHKILHIRSYDGVASSFSNFATPGNVPIVIPGFKVDHDLGYARVWYYSAYRCEENYYCQGTPSYSFDVPSDHDAVLLGRWDSTIGDGNWHTLKFYFKTNTNTGSTFNSDGIHRFYIDDVLKFEATNIPFSDNGSDEIRRKWNWISVGGNNSNRFTVSCSGTSCEQWYAIDDVVISTSDISKNYVINSTGKRYLIKSIIKQD